MVWEEALRQLRVSCEELTGWGTRCRKKGAWYLRAIRREEELSYIIGAW